MHLTIGLKICKEKKGTSALSHPPLLMPVLRLVTSTDPTVAASPPEYPANGQSDVDKSVQHKSTTEKKERKNHIHQTFDELARLILAGRFLPDRSSMDDHLEGWPGLITQITFKEMTFTGTRALKDTTINSGMHQFIRAAVKIIGKGNKKR